MKGLPDFFENFDRRGGFPALPEVISEIVHEVDAERLSMADLARLVQKDVSFSAQILAHANSPMYMMPNRVTSVTRAIQIIGLRPLKALCLSMPLFTRFRHILGVPELWYHSRVSALCCRIVAESFEKTMKVEPEVAETVGLIHDMGKIFLFLEAEEFMKEQIQVSDQPSRLADWKMERENLGIDHSFIGARFGRKFNFPQAMLDAILYHHEPEKAQHNRELVYICGLGDQIASLVGATHPDYLFVEPQILEFINHMGVYPSHFRGILEQCVRRAMGISLFDADSSPR